jgi:membrane associated rhomboid family serine protease
MFLHGSLSHLLLNSYSTQNIGPEVERLFGGGRFLATYIIGGKMDFANIRKSCLLFVLYISLDGL